MFRTSNLFDEKRIHLIFEISLWLKGVFALAEVVAGVAAYFISQQFLLSLVLWVTKEEFAEDPHDLVANFILHAVQNFSVGTQKFVAFYLLAHGVKASEIQTEWFGKTHPRVPTQDGVRNQENRRAEIYLKK